MYEIYIKYWDYYGDPSGFVYLTKPVERIILDDTSEIIKFETLDNAKEQLLEIIDDEEYPLAYIAIEYINA